MRRSIVLRCSFASGPLFGLYSSGPVAIVSSLCKETDTSLSPDQVRKFPMAERLIDSFPTPSAPMSSALAPSVRKTAFIDLEASGLGSKSWPVEVAWGFVDGPPRSLLIRPDAAWPDEAWDKGAEALHGLTRVALRREGSDVREVCRTLNRALGRAEVYSDAPDWDAFWLIRLFSAGGVRQEFSILDYARLIGELAGTRTGELQERAGRLAPRRHRAAADVAHLQTLYRLAAESCGPRLTR